MTPCRPTDPRPACWQCERTRLPTEHKNRNGTVVQDVCMDVVAVIGKKACPLWVPVCQ